MAKRPPKPSGAGSASPDYLLAPADKAHATLADCLNFPRRFVQEVRVVTGEVGASRSWVFIANTWLDAGVGE